MSVAAPTPPAVAFHWPDPADLPGVRVPGRPDTETRAVRRGVVWAEYVALADDPAWVSKRITYDGPAGGLLEVEMGEGPLHGSVCELVPDFIKSFCRARRIRRRAFGSLALRRQDLDRGLDTDRSFYLTRVADAPPRTRSHIDLDRFPPPDLCLEVDVTSPGVSKLPIYAALGVPEVWVWSAATGMLVARRLAGGGYEVVDDSVELPGFPLVAAAGLVADPGGRSDEELLEAFEAHLRPG